MDEDGSEYSFDQNTPIRNVKIWAAAYMSNFITLPHGAIQAITGRTLTWQDEPIEWKPGEDNVREALENLVQLKDWKDKHGKDEQYEKHQPAAWEAARKALKLNTNELDKNK